MYAEVPQNNPELTKLATNARSFRVFPYKILCHEYQKLRNEAKMYSSFTLTWLMTFLQTLPLFSMVERKEFHLKVISH